MKYLALYILILLIHPLLFSQEHKDRSIYLELAGNGGIGSVNYEADLFTKEKKHLCWRAGLSGFPIDKNNGFAFVIPLSANFIYGRDHQLELGIGQSLTVTTKVKLFVRTVPIVGYRFQPAEKSWFIRVSYTPLISNIWDIQYQHWGGISFGFKLKSKE